MKASHTKISDILELETTDETKKNMVCQISTIDYLNREKFYNCYWCRNPFDEFKLGCPIKWVPSNAVKTYYSEVSKDNYAIRENVTNKKSKSKTKSKDIKIEEKAYYETDGCFCSFNCIKAFIIDNKHDLLYKDSLNMLSKMYYDIFSSYDIIKPSPSYRLLKEYGGHLTIDEYRTGLSNVKYDYKGIVMHSIGKLYEKQIEF